MAGQPTVDAEIGFLGDCPRRPVFHDDPSDDDFLPIEQHRVSISAVLDERESYRLGLHGIEVFRGPGIDVDPLSGPTRSAYLRALEQIIGTLTGASRVVAIGNGVVRRSERAQRYRCDETTVLGRFAHCDFSRTASGSRLWVEKMLPPTEACERLPSRYAIYNIWKSLSEPPQDTPLAFCHPASMGKDDAVGCDQVIRTAEGEGISYELTLYRYSDRQRWFYFPDIQRNELLIFTGFDSDAAWPQGIPHAAFTDPSCPADAAPRESFDERLIAFFD